MNKKWWLSIIGGSVLVLVMPVLAGCSGPAAAQSASNPNAVVQANSVQSAMAPIQISQQSQGIWVSGTGEVSITPDIANLTLGVDAVETSVAQAQSEASDAMTKVMKALTDGGIAQKDIQTGYFSISQRTRWDDSKQINTPIGYEVTNMVTVKIRDTGKVSNIIDSVVQAGGNNIRINGINFSVENPAQYYTDARKKAMAAALSKAQELAKLAGVTLGKPTYIVENAEYAPTYNRYANFAVAAPALDSGASTPISTGETKITLSVQVAYGITQ